MNFWNLDDLLWVRGSEGKSGSVNDLALAEAKDAVGARAEADGINNGL